MFNRYHKAEGPKSGHVVHQSGSIQRAAYAYDGGQDNSTVDYLPAHACRPDGRQCH